MKITRLFSIFVYLVATFGRFVHGQSYEVSIPDTTISHTLTQLTLPIVINSNPPNENIYSYTGKLRWDSDVLAYSSYNIIGSLTSSWINYVANDSSGLLFFGDFTHNRPISGNGILVELVFDIIGSPKDSTTLVWDWFFINNESINTFNGMIKIEGYRVNITIDPSNSGKVRLDPNFNEYAPNKKIIITATPNDEYSFEHWSGDLTGFENPTPFVIYQDMNIKAHFREDNVVSVELSDFTGTTLSDNILLNWKTLSETNNLYFLILRREDDQSLFERIPDAVIAGKGTTLLEHFYSYRDENIQPGIQYFYQLQQVDYDGSSTFYGPIEVTAVAPETYNVLMNYPNPFNPNTIIRYRVNKTARLSVDIYNLRGVPVRNLLNCEQSAGVHEIQWDGRNKQGQAVPSGIYFCRLKNGRRTCQIKIILER